MAEEITKVSRVRSLLVVKNSCLLEFNKILEVRKFLGHAKILGSWGKILSGEQNWLIEAPFRSLMVFRSHLMETWWAKSFFDDPIMCPCF